MRFNTLFLLQACVVTAAVCLPMALNRESGFVWTAFLLPMCFGLLIARQVELRGELEFKFRKLPGSVVEISTVGGKQKHWLMRARIIAAGVLLSVVFGIPMLHQVDPEPPAMWAPIVALFALIAIVLLGLSMRRLVLVETRQLVTSYLLFGWRCWGFRPWQVRDGDYLMVLAMGDPEMQSKLEFHFTHSLVVCRSQQRHTVAFCTSAREEVIPGMEFAAQLVAQLMEIPYEGYEFKRISLQTGRSARTPLARKSRGALDPLGNLLS